MERQLASNIGTRRPSTRTPNTAYNPARRPLSVRLRQVLCELLPRLLAVAFIWWSVVAGLQLRTWTFESTAPVRFRGDIQNGLNQGARVLRNTGVPAVKGTRIPLRFVLPAWVDTYDIVEEQARGSGRYSLDYAPLRLLVMTLWVREVWHDRGETTDYDDAMTGPLMSLNATLLGLAAVGAFFLTRFWARPTGPHLPGSPAPPQRLPLGLPLAQAYLTWRGLLTDLRTRHGPWLIALTAATLVWFNPACLINAHAFPQWDVWVLPFFIFACYAASRNFWTSAGVLLVLGAMLKGQVLLVAPVLIAWPLLQGRVGAALRLAIGAAAGVALVTWPWLIRSADAVWWIGIALAAILILAIVRALARQYLTHRTPPLSRAAQVAWVTVTVLTAEAALVALCYPLRGTLPAGGAIPITWTLAVALAALTAVACLLAKGWRSLPYVLLGVVGIGVLLAGARFGGSWSWYAIGYEFPSDNYQAAAMGPTANLPAILAQRYGWELKEPITWAPTWAGTLTFQTAMRALYFALLVPIAIMLAHHAKRGSPKVLLCLAAPWILMFAFVPQMHERYLIWGAAMTALCIAAGGGYLFLHLVTTFIAFACVATQILHQNHGWWPAANRLFFPMIPDIGWAVTLLALFYLGATLTGFRQPKPPAPPAQGATK